MAKTLSNVSSEATEQTNTTGLMTPILSFQPDDGMLLKLINDAVQRGDESGVPVFAELKDSTGNPLPVDTDLSIRYDAPHLDEPQTASEVKTNIQVYNSHTVETQQSTEYIDAAKFELKGIALVARDIDTIEIAAKSSAQIDWANSRLYIAEKAVRELKEE